MSSTAHAREAGKLWFSYNATTFYDRDRKLKKSNSRLARDVTERNRLDRALAEKNVELGKR